MPAYNEGKRIGNTLNSYLRYKWKYPIEIIVVLNGCTDNTLDVVKKFHKIKYGVLKQPSKGNALITGFKLAKGDLIGYVDADNATKASELAKLVDNIGDYDGVIGSRWWLKGVKLIKKQPLLRRILSRGFNVLSRIILGLEFNDTQCPAKIFRKKAIKSVVNKIIKTNWAIDVSILYPLIRNGYKIKEVGISWEDKTGSKLRIMKAIPNMLLALLKIRFKR